MYCRICGKALNYSNCGHDQAVPVEPKKVKLKKTIKEIHHHHTTYVEREKKSCDGDFLTSVVIGAVTGSSIIGGLVGGSFLGGLMGDMLEGNDDSNF